MSTTADLLAATRRLLDVSGRDQMNKLGADLDAFSTTLNYAKTQGAIQPGALLSVGLETMYVWDAAGSLATVERGFAGSTPATHTAGDLVYVNPRVSGFAVLDAINADLAELSALGLYRVKSLDLTAVGGQYAYDLASDVRDVLDVRWKDTASNVTKDWFEIDTWEVVRDMPTSDYPSGVALRFDRSRQQPIANQTIRVRYAANFTTLSALTDDVAATTGLPVTALDLPPLGAACRLADSFPMLRADINRQGGTRRPEEVSTTDTLQAGGALRARRAARIADEVNRLALSYPPRLRAR